MFGLKMHTVCRVTSWQDAADTLNRATRLKQRSDGSYPLPGKERNKDISVRMVNDGIAFRYHHTDVVTWRPDGSYTYEPWSSRSTCTFFNQLCPIGHDLTRAAEVLIIGDKGYAIYGGSPVHVRDCKPVSGLGVFQRQVIDRKRAKEVLAGTRYAEYREWYKVMMPMLMPRSGEYLSPNDAVLYLRDETKWPALATERWDDFTPDKMRGVIYFLNSESCYKTETYDVLPANKAQRSEYRVMRRA